MAEGKMKAGASFIKVSAILFSIAVILLAAMFSGNLVFGQGTYTYSCSDSQRIMKLFSSMNSHGELWNGTVYDIDVCYNEIFGENYTGSNPHACNGTNKLVGLFADTNSHGEISNLSNYIYNVCYGDLECSAKTECNYDEKLIVGLYSYTNSHLGAYSGTSNTSTDRIVVTQTSSSDKASAYCPAGYFLAGSGFKCKDGDPEDVIPYSDHVNVDCEGEGSTIAQAVCVKDDRIEDVTIIEKKSDTDKATAYCPIDYQVIGSGFHCHKGHDPEDVKLNLQANSVHVDCDDEKNDRADAYAICAKPVAGFEINMTELYASANKDKVISSSCSSDKVLVSGGFRCSNGDPENSQPIGASWYVDCDSGKASSWAYCMKVTEDSFDYPLKMCCKSPSRNPVVQIFANDTIDTMSYTFRANVSDESDIAAVTIKIIDSSSSVVKAGIMEEDWANPGKYEAWLYLDLARGNYSVEVEAEDIHGNYGKAAKDIFLNYSMQVIGWEGIQQVISKDGGGTAIIEFTTISRGGDTVRFTMEDISTLSTEAMNTSISNIYGTAIVRNEFNESGQLQVGTGDPITGKFNLTLTFTNETVQNLSVGEYPINYSVWLDIAPMLFTNTGLLGSLSAGGAPSIYIIEGPLDTNAPVVNLITPADNYSINETPVIFEYNVSDESNISSCSLIIDGSVVESDFSITKDILQNFSRSLGNGNYTWQVNCSDEFSNVGESESRTLEVTGISVVCSVNSDCGTDSWIGDSYCSSDDVWQVWRTWTCNNPGTASSYCSYSDSSQLKIDCEDECDSGVCEDDDDDDSGGGGVSGGFITLGEYCGDGICDESENESNCAEDCVKVVSDEKKVIRLSQAAVGTRKISPLILVISLLSIIALALLIYVMWKKR